ncbi:uncharacterized protein [Littorina saxatilis]|uniref:uncharacterized protein n=1 Tax=Littorina saxatilis TaxID=31220 RepID=UPI0038B45D9A
MALTVFGVISLRNVRAQSLQLVFLGLGLLQPGLAQDRAVERLELTVEGQTTPPTTVTQLEAGEHTVKCWFFGFYPRDGPRLNFTMWAQPSGRGQPRGTPTIISDNEMYRALQYFAIEVKNTTTSLSCWENESFGGSPVTATLKIYKCSLQWVEAALNDNPRPDVPSPGLYFRQPYNDTIRCEASLFCGGSTLPSVPHAVLFEVWLDKKKLDIPPVTSARIQQRTKGVPSCYDVQQNFSTDFTKKDHGKNVTCKEIITGMRSRFPLMLFDPNAPTTTSTLIIGNKGGELNVTRVGSSKGQQGMVLGLGIAGGVAALALICGLLAFGKKRATGAKPSSVAGGPQAPGSGAVAGGSGPPMPAVAAGYGPVKDGPTKSGCTAAGGSGPPMPAVAAGYGPVKDGPTKSGCTAAGCSGPPLPATAAGYGYVDDGASAVSESTSVGSSVATTTTETSTTEADESAVDLIISPLPTTAEPCTTECGERCTVCGTIMTDNV